MKNTHQKFNPNEVLSELTQIDCCLKVIWQGRVDSLVCEDFIRYQLQPPLVEKGNQPKRYGADDEFDESDEYDDYY